MRFSALKSLTFLVGLVIFIGAFAALVLAGSLFNPPPYNIVVALQDIPAYTTLTPDMLGTDEQTMNERVAARMVHQGELEKYLGGTVIEPIHAGEPLRRMAVVASDNPAAKKRLALALDDPNTVAMVIPVSPDIVPDTTQAGDYVDIQMGVGQVQQVSNTFGNDNAAVEDEEQVVLPFAKIVLQYVPVLQAQHKRIANPNYGVNSFGGGDSGAAAQPAFIDGDLERLVVLIPREAQETLAFAIANGDLQISLVPHIAVENVLPAPSYGVTWEDFLAFFRQERETAAGMIEAGAKTLPDTSAPGASPAASPSPLTATHTLTPSASMTSANTLSPVQPQPPQNAPGAVAVEPGSQRSIAGAVAGGAPASAPVGAGGGQAAAGSSPTEQAAAMNSELESLSISSFIMPAVIFVVFIFIVIAGVTMLRKAKKNRPA